jgi:putative hemolysin
MTVIDAGLKSRTDESRPRFAIGEMRSAADIRSEWGKLDLLALPDVRKSKYIAGFACSDRAIRAAQALRFEVFNLELDEGFAESYASGLDEDIYDEQMSHLLLIEADSHKVIGTYRMQTIAQARAAKGIYSDQEYDVAALEPYFAKSVELGRACLAEGHRSFATLLMLWFGIGAFMNFHESRWAFGCCSITTRDPDDGWRTLKTLRRENYMHPTICVPARAHASCGSAERIDDPALGEAIPLPKLFHTYMKLGTQVVSEPAIDRAFGTVDFLVMIDSQAVTLSSLDVVKRS